MWIICVEIKRAFGKSSRIGKEKSWTCSKAEIERWRNKNVATNGEREGCRAQEWRSRSTGAWDVYSGSPGGPENAEFPHFPPFRPSYTSLRRDTPFNSNVTTSAHSKSNNFVLRRKKRDSDRKQTRLTRRLTSRRSRWRHGRKWMIIWRLTHNKVRFGDFSV